MYVSAMTPDWNCRGSCDTAIRGLRCPRISLSMTFMTWEVSATGLILYWFVVVSCAYKIYNILHNLEWCFIQWSFTVGAAVTQVLMWSFLWLGSPCTSCPGAPLNQKLLLIPCDLPHFPLGFSFLMSFMSPKAPVVNFAGKDLKCLSSHELFAVQGGYTEVDPEGQTLWAFMAIISQPPAVFNLVLFIIENKLMFWWSEPLRSDFVFGSLLQYFQIKRPHYSREICLCFFIYGLLSLS